MGNAPKTQITVTTIGARRHYAVPRLLQNAELLDRFYTDSYIGNKPWLEKLLRIVPTFLAPKGVQRWLGRRDQVLQPKKVVSFEALGIWYVWAQSRATVTNQIEQIYCEMARRFNRNIIASGLRSAAIVWANNGAALELFRYVKKRGGQCILEQTSNPKPIEKRLAAEEFERWHDWLPVERRADNDHNLLLGRERAEWALADRIIVGSGFVESGLIHCGVPKSKIRVIPYGLDLARFSRIEKPDFDGKRPLRVLFVGGVSIMKGIPYLLKALDALGSQRVEAKLIGGISIKRSKLEHYRGVATAIGQIPRPLVAAQYQWADVFCFPSITEGSATVTYEAIASGLPVITTPNAGSIVRDGVDGFLVPIRDPASLAEALLRYFEAPDLLSRHQRATDESRQMAGLARYRADIERLIHGLLPTL